MPRDARDPHDERAFALACELRGAVSALNRRLREQATTGDLTNAQKAVLLRLERDGPATASALARAEAMRPQSMGAVVAALAAAGHVSCAPDPTDGRRTIVSLSDGFQDWLCAARAARRDWLFRAVRAELTAEERDHLARTVVLLRRIIEF